MNLLALYSIIVRELNDCFFETCKHQIAFDTVARSNMEQRAIEFPSNSSFRECLACHGTTQQSKFVSFPSATQTLLIEWIHCVSLGCPKHTPQLKLTNCLHRPLMLTARMNQNLYLVERIYSNYIDTKWEREMDEACHQKIPPDLVHIICAYDPFHFVHFT